MAFPSQYLFHLDGGNNFVTDALGLLETTGYTPAIVALDAMEKAGDVRVLQAEINDFLGIIIKIQGPLDAVASAIDTGYEVAKTMGGEPVADVIPRVSDAAWPAVESAAEYNPLIQQDVVHLPLPSDAAIARDLPLWSQSMSTTENYALGLIETQGFTAVFEAIDTACKAANVEVVGKEKLGGGYVTVVIKGDVAAVNAAIDAGKERVPQLGTLIAAHVISRPSESVLGLLP